MKVDTEVVSVSDEFRKTLSSHLVLIYTGKTRLARNLLQNVVRNWYARDPALVANADALVANAERSFQVPARQQRRVCARTDRRVPVARRDCCAHTRACVLFFFSSSCLLSCFFWLRWQCLRHTFDSLAALLPGAAVFVSAPRTCACGRLQALKDGDLPQTGACLDKYWEQKKFMAPGCEPGFVRRCACVDVLTSPEVRCSQRSRGSGPALAGR